jgi:hypothetical protein
MSTTPIGLDILMISEPLVSSVALKSKSGKILSSFLFSGAFVSARPFVAK